MANDTQEKREILMTISKQSRIEKDALGEISIEEGRYWGSFTQRALETFGKSQDENTLFYYKIYIEMKLACARANISCGMLAADKGRAIEKACIEAQGEKFNEQFPLGFYQAGAGTPFNMNSNEVIANRANEIMGAPLGSYRFVHPNNDVNMCQSSNDLGPTAIRLAILELSGGVKKNARCLCETLDAKVKKYAGKVKVGRTHIQDAVPVGIDQEIMAWSDSIKSDIAVLEAAETELLEIPLGGTALGTGIAAHPDFSKKASSELAKITGKKTIPMKNKHMGISMLNPILTYAGALKRLNATLVKIANDLKLLMSGPNAGIAEAILPEVEPGSSIMPGKINPSVPEAVEIIARDNIAKEHAIEQAAMSGQLQLNVLTPLVAKNMIEMMRNTDKALGLFEAKCISGLEYDLEVCDSNMQKTFVLATALNPYLGYQAVAEIVKESLKIKKPVRDVVLLHRLISEKELNAILDISRLVKPAAIDNSLVEKTRQSENYKIYLQKIGKAPK